MTNRKSQRELQAIAYALADEIETRARQLVARDGITLAAALKRTIITISEGA